MELGLPQHELPPPELFAGFNILPELTEAQLQGTNSILISTEQKLSPEDFTIGGTNSTALIENLKYLTIRDRRVNLNNLAPYRGDCKKSPTIREMLVCDNETVNTMGLTHQKLAEFLAYFIKAQTYIEENKVQADAFAYNGKVFIFAPSCSTGLRGVSAYDERVWQITGKENDHRVSPDETICLNDGRSIKFLPLNIAMIWGYGFYCGYTGRIDPEVIATMAGYDTQLAKNDPVAQLVRDPAVSVEISSTEQLQRLLRLSEHKIQRLNNYTFVPQNVSALFEFINCYTKRKLLGNKDEDMKCDVEFISSPDGNRDLFYFPDSSIKTIFEFAEQLMVTIDLSKMETSPDFFKTVSKSEIKAYVNIANSLKDLPKKLQEWVLKASQEPSPPPPQLPKKRDGEKIFVDPAAEKLKEFSAALSPNLTEEVRETAIFLFKNSRYITEFWGKSPSAQFARAISEKLLSKTKPTVDDILNVYLSLLFSNFEKLFSSEAIFKKLNLSEFIPFGNSRVQVTVNRAFIDNNLPKKNIEEFPGLPSLGKIDVPMLQINEKEYFLFEQLGVSYYRSDKKIATLHLDSEGNRLWLSN